MPLECLEARQFRNLQTASIRLTHGIQLVYGDNASGKTSLLEAMHVLCGGKSFLAASARKMQQFGSDAFSISGLSTQRDHPPQRLRYRWQAGHIHLEAGSEIVRRTSQYAAIQPVQAITPLSYKIIDDRPEIRRRFMDWGVFHVKQEYSSIWRQFQRCLNQRNSLLHRGADPHAISAWNKEYVRQAEALHSYRHDYMNQLQPILASISERLLAKKRLSVRYTAGWDREKGLSQLLEDNLQRDLERKFSYYGPQRADFSIHLDGHTARDTASRGQKKLITFALYLAQASLQQAIGHKKALLLIDDLPSELDTQHQAVILQVLQDSSMQAVISCINPGHLAFAANEPEKRFHVKHGRVTEVV